MSIIDLNNFLSSISIRSLGTWMNNIWLTFPTYLKVLIRYLIAIGGLWGVKAILYKISPNSRKLAQILFLIISLFGALLLFVASINYDVPFIVNVIYFILFIVIIISEYKLGMDKNIYMWLKAKRPTELEKVMLIIVACLILATILIVICYTGYNFSPPRIDSFS